MSIIDIEKVVAEANKEVNEEFAAKAKKALIASMRRLESAKQVVRGIEAELTDLKASIADGSFV